MNAHSIITKAMNLVANPQNHPVTDAPIANTNQLDGGICPKGLAILVICNNSAERADVTVLSSHLICETPQSCFPSMVVFGESGVGKTSIVNMLAGKEIFPVGRAAVGTTLESQGCLIKCEGLSLNVYGTVGLNEPATGTVSAKKAIPAN
jgi:hypothetical protein